jgi:hypothetical protein
VTKIIYERLNINCEGEVTGKKLVKRGGGGLLT